MRVVAALLIGLILGVTIMNAYTSNQYESLSAKNKALEQQLSDLTTDLEEMNKRLAITQKNKIINDVKANVELAEDNDLPTFERTSVILDGENKIDNLLMTLKGQETKSINHNLIPKIINGREFISEGRRYSLTVNVVIITDEINVYATARLIKAN
jgi:hypothetical protein